MPRLPNCRGIGRRDNHADRLSGNITKMELESTLGASIHDRQAILYRQVMPAGNSS